MNKRLTAGLGAGAIAAAAGVYGLVTSLTGGTVDTAGAVVTHAGAQALQAAGIDTVVQASTWWPSCSSPASTPSTALDTLRNVRDVGMGSAGYFFVTPYDSGQQAVDKAYNGIGADNWQASRFQALDVEIPDVCYPNTKLDINEICSAMDALSARGAPRIIYTSYHEWVDHLGNPQHCPNTYLWLASWNGKPELNDQLFGGWTAADVVLKQYHGDTSLAGISVDLDSTVGIFPWEVQPTPAPAEWDVVCNADGLSHNPIKALWMPAGNAFFDDNRAAWFTSPACNN